MFPIFPDGWMIIEPMFVNHITCPLYNRKKLKNKFKVFRKCLLLSSLIERRVCSHFWVLRCDHCEESIGEGRRQFIFMIPLHLILSNLQRTSVSRHRILTAFVELFSLMNKCVNYREAVDVNHCLTVNPMLCRENPSHLKNSRCNNDLQKTLSQG